MKGVPNPGFAARHPHLRRGGDRPRPLAIETEARWRALCDLAIGCADHPEQDAGELARARQGVTGMARPPGELAQKALRVLGEQIDLFCLTPPSARGVLAADVLRATAEQAWRHIGGLPPELRSKACGKED